MKHQATLTNKKRDCSHNLSFLIYISLFLFFGVANLSAGAASQFIMQEEQAIDTISIRDIFIDFLPADNQELSDSGYYNVKLTFTLAGDDSLLNKIHVKVYSGENQAVQLFNHSITYSFLSSNPVQLSATCSYHTENDEIIISLKNINELLHLPENLLFTFQFELMDGTNFPLINRKGTLIK